MEKVLAITKNPQPCVLCWQCLNFMLAQSESSSSASRYTMLAA